MAEAPAATRSENGTPPTPPPTVPRGETGPEALARVVDVKLKQGYEVESRSDTQAVLVMKGRRRWFGLANRPDSRYEVTVDESGSAKSRRL